MNCNKNIELANLLEKLGNTYRDDVYRKRSYTNAATAIRKCKTEIKSGKEALKIKGIGKSTAEKIDEFINTGKILLLEERLKIPLTDKENVIELFRQIHSVGPATAEKWYNKGYRKLEDLANIYEDMTRSQKIGYYYFYHLKERIPRNEIKIIESKIKHCLDQYDMTFSICGSYRRGESNSGDIDCLIMKKEFTTMDSVVEIFKREDVNLFKISQGKSKFMGLIQLSKNHCVRHIDILLVGPDQWPYATLYFTGSKDLNVMMRTKAIELGYTLNEYCMQKKDGSYFSAKTEQDIFKELEMEYIPPTERSIGSK